VIAKAIQHSQKTMVKQNEPKRFWRMLYPCKNTKLTAELFSLDRCLPLAFFFFKGSPQICVEDIYDQPVDF
jgi:hypothetical protein